MTRNNIGDSLWRSCDHGKMLQSKQAMPVHKTQCHSLPGYGENTKTIRTNFFPGSWTLNKHSDCCHVFGILMWWNRSCDMCQ
jgi:hypothetical protein